MSLWTGAEAAAATGGETGDWVATGVSIDTRTLQPGDLFVALKDQRDGHDFVADAFAKGAAAALVTHRPEGVTEDAPLLIVPDVLKALEDLGRAARARTKAKVFAVTGSVGKTGTKEMLRTALSALGRTHAAEKSYNNHWGVPLTLARMPADTEFAVIEIGMNAPGEIAPLARLAAPHVAMITTVAPVHLAAFESVEGIAREKASIYEGLVPDGIAVANCDIATFPILRDAAPGPLVTFGESEAADMRLVRADLHDDVTAVEVRWRGAPIVFKLNAPGRHLAMNAAGVVAAVGAAGLDLARICLALGQWVPPEGRGARWQIALGPGGIDGSVMLIDESYNANPVAMGAAFEVFARTRPVDDIGRVRKGRRIAFLGDMLELGETAEDLHSDLAQHPAMEAITLVHCAGPLMRALYDALPASKRGEWHEDSTALASRVPRLVDAGDVVMVKGSLGSGLGIVVDAIKKLGDATDMREAGGSD